MGINKRSSQQRVELGLNHNTVCRMISISSIGSWLGKKLVKEDAAWGESNHNLLYLMQQKIFLKLM